MVSYVETTKNPRSHGLNTKHPDLTGFTQVLLQKLKIYSLSYYTDIY